MAEWTVPDMICAPETLSDRIVALKSRVQHGASSSSFLAGHRRLVFERVFRERALQPRTVQIAEGLAAFLREKELVLFREDILAGHEQFYDYTLPSLPEVTRSLEESRVMETYDTGERIGLWGSCMGGHVVAGYERVLQTGFGGLAERARRKIAVTQGPLREFAQACLIVCEAASDYCIRYAAEAWNRACGASADEARNMRRIADACQWLAAEPPQSFFEAVQLLWLTHEIITCEQSSGSISLGRLDRYLYSFYEKDIAAGILTRAGAAEIIQALWIKFNGMKRGFQNVTLGGPGPDGVYAANDLSRLCLGASRLLQMDQPLLSVRWRQDMPDDFWEDIVELLATGQGFPALFNDEMVVEAKKRVGVDAVDAERYAVVGCVEPTVPGKEFSHTEGLRINWAKIIELMLDRNATGRCILREPRRLDSVDTFDRFHAWYRSELEHAVELGARALNIMDREFAQRSPYPFLSATMECCLDAGKDVTGGGTRYCLSSINAAGMANAVDSLMAVKRTVYRDKQLSLPEMADVLRSDFENAESLQAGLARAMERYGNDMDDADTMLAELARVFCGAVEGRRNPRGGAFQCGFYTVNWHGWMGELTGALPDGRRRGMAIANGLSPCQGTDAKGPTALIRSVTRLDHRLFGNGMVLDMKFTPAVFADPEQRQKFRHLVETYFRLGGMEVQFNVVNRETLLEAQRHPEAHRNLLVRVSGFSDYFTDLSRTCQDEIIARTEFSEV